MLHDWPVIEIHTIGLVIWTLGVFIGGIAIGVAVGNSESETKKEQ